MHEEERRKFILDKRQLGLTHREIGILLGISRQRVHQILNKKEKPFTFIKDRVIKENIVKISGWCKLCTNKRYCDKHLYLRKFGGRELTREKIRIRDNHTCQSCGEIWKIGRRRFDIHHKDNVKEKTRQYDNYEKEKDNLITLCHRCHLNLPQHKLTMKNAVRNYLKKEKIYKEKIYKVKLPKEYNHILPIMVCLLREDGYMLDEIAYMLDFKNRIQVLQAQEKGRKYFANLSQIACG